MAPEGLSLACRDESERPDDAADERTFGVVFLHEAAQPPHDLLKNHRRQKYQPRQGRWQLRKQRHLADRNQSGPVDIRRDAQHLESPVQQGTEHAEMRKVIVAVAVKRLEESHGTYKAPAG